MFYHKYISCLRSAEDIAEAEALKEHKFPTDVKDINELFAYAKDLMGHVKTGRASMYKICRLFDSEDPFDLVPVIQKLQRKGCKINYDFRIIYIPNQGGGYYTLSFRRPEQWQVREKAKANRKYRQKNGHDKFKELIKAKLIAKYGGIACQS